MVREAVLEDSNDRKSGDQTIHGLGIILKNQ